MQYKVCFLVQGQQHHNTLLSIAKILGKDFEVVFLIDTMHFILKKQDFHKPFKYKLLSDYKYPELPSYIPLPTENHSFFTQATSFKAICSSYINTQVKKLILLRVYFIKAKNSWIKLCRAFCLKMKIYFKQIISSVYKIISFPFGKLFFITKSWLQQYPFICSKLFNTKSNLQSWSKSLNFKSWSKSLNFKSWSFKSWLKQYPFIYSKVHAIYSKVHLLFKSWLKQYPFIYSKAQILFYAKNSLAYHSTQDSIKNFISVNKVDILILAEANVEYLSECYIKQFRAAKKATIVIPYTFCSPTEPASYYYNNRNYFYRWYHKSLLDKKWVYTLNKRKLIRMPLINIIAIDMLDVAPPNPWVQESSTANALLAESEMIKQHYLKHSIDAKQIQCIGDISHDLIYQAYKKKKELKTKLCEELSLDPQKKILLFAVFPDFMPLRVSKTEFRSYEQMLEFICTELNKLDAFNVVLCLHPRLKKESFAFLKHLNIKISSHPTSELIALADLYVASISATIKWAIALGIPVINYDVYKFRYGDYNTVPGVLNIETIAKFSALIKKLNKDPTYLKQLANALKKVKKNWGIIDGKFHLRIQNLIKNLINENRA